jgi:hypothetical protein
VIYNFWKTPRRVVKFLASTIHHTFHIISSLNGIEIDTTSSVCTYVGHILVISVALVCPSNKTHKNWSENQRLMKDLKWVNFHRLLYALILKGVSARTIIYEYFLKNHTRLDFFSELV